MIITTERLHYLWAVAETGSFAAAGRRLGVSGAAVQQVIRHFEQDRSSGISSKIWTRPCSGAARAAVRC